MTEEEAKTKWCPFARVVAYTAREAGQAAFNRACGPNDGANTRPAALCFGSACMAWRTAQVGRVLPGDEHKTYREQGFCGLAGAPQ